MWRSPVDVEEEIEISRSSCHKDTRRACKQERNAVKNMSTTAVYKVQLREKVGDTRFNAKGVLIVNMIDMAL